MITEATESIERGGSISISATGEPGALCQIAAGELGEGLAPELLAPRAANREGRVSWSWRIGPLVLPGSYAVSITCGGRTATATVMVKD